MNEPSIPSAQGLNNALLDAWVERIFMRLHGRFGNQFFDKFRAGKLDANGNDVGIENAKRVWGEELGGFSVEEIKTGLAARFAYPPSLDEFMLACRPKSNAKAEWAEAVEQMRIRLEAQGRDRWSRPQVYWAALDIGWHDLNLLSWDSIRARWEAALAKARSDAIPVYREALPKPGAATISRDEAQKRVAEIARQTGIKPGTPNKEWAEKIFARWAAGDEVADIVIDFAERALGRTRPERGRHV